MKDLFKLIAGLAILGVICFFIYLYLDKYNPRDKYTHPRLAPGYLQSK